MNRNETYRRDDMKQCNVMEYYGKSKMNFNIKNENSML